MDNDNSNFSHDQAEYKFEKVNNQYDLENFACISDYNNIIPSEKKHLSKTAIVLFLLTVILISVFALFCVVSEIFNFKSGFYSPRTNTTIILGLNEKPGQEQFRDENGKYTAVGIADHVGPSIVEILTYADATHSAAVGSGSGIIMSDDGYIVTNAHVINSAKFLAVSLSDKSVYDASVVGYDSKTDIAVIQVDSNIKKLSPAEFGNSDNVVQGEQVLAIGNPGGLTGSISGGYVSGINRMIKADQTGYEMNCIQTDAAISPGNSGGALVNMYGQVIGITSSKYVSSSYEGLGFAITINEAKPIIEQLIAEGHITGRFKIGITFYTVTDEFIKSKSLPEGIKGLMIESIDPECDIASSGLMVNDIIIEAEGKKAYDYNSLMKAIEGKKVGDTVRVKVLRIDNDKNQTQLDIKFKLMEDTSGDY